MKPILFIVGLESSGTRWLSRSIHSCFTKAGNWDGEFPPCKTTHLFDIFHVSIPFGGWCMPLLPRLYHTSDCDTFRKTQPKERWILDIPKALTNPTAKAIVIRRHPRDQFASKMRNHCKNESSGASENQRGNELILQSIQKHKEKVFVLDYEYMDDKWQWPELMKWLNMSCPLPPFKLPSEPVLHPPTANRIRRTPDDTVRKTVG